MNLLAVPELAGTLLRDLAEYYSTTGFERSGVTSVTSLGHERSQPAVESALAYLEDIEAIFRSDGERVLLSPALRIDLLSPALLLSWSTTIEAAGDAWEAAEATRRARDELHALSAYAFALGNRLPPANDAPMAGVAGLLAMPGLSLDALPVVARHPGSPYAKFRYLVKVPPESALSAAELQSQLRINVSAKPSPPRESLPMPRLKPMLEQAARTRLAESRGESARWRGVAVATPRRAACCAMANRPGHRH